ncbi:hypothetical protein BO71DRAFT_151248 [Aspergillus ellipticus CBS 707.79]|uniref:Uncharacterized protein n=1 Tax=Aspergillus ellipticus CBS 707.79 TaxID=1448320 RepID=A0A319DHL2_9EURO|nr:hypothetical protein BO71DRAFT_151248 [Aspergillus ellipticus CBS 707.79]
MLSMTVSTWYGSGCTTLVPPSRIQFNLGLLLCWCPSEVFSPSLSFVYTSSPSAYPLRRSGNCSIACTWLLLSFYSSWAMVNHHLYFCSLPGRYYHRMLLCTHQRPIAMGEEHGVWWAKSLVLAPTTIINQSKRLACLIYLYVQSLDGISS